MIKITVTYSDLACLLKYTEHLIILVNRRGLDNEICLQKCRAFISELYIVQGKLRSKLWMWPLDRRKSLRTVSVSFMQGYILWLHYEHQAEYILINDKIELIAKHLTN